MAKQKPPASGCGFGKFIILGRVPSYCWDVLWADARDNPDQPGFYPLSAEDITVSGVGPNVVDPGGMVLEQYRNPTGADSEQWRIVLNPIKDAASPFVFQIDRVCLITSDAEPCKMVEGPWRFELTPDVDPSDLALTKLPIGAKQSIQGVTISVEEVAASSSEILVRYSISDDLVSTVGAGLELILPDGTALIPAIERIHDAARVAVFTPLPAKLADFTLAIRSLISEERRHVPVDVTLDLQDEIRGLSLDAPTRVTVPVGESFDIGGQQVTIRDLSVGSGDVAFTLVTTGPSLLPGVDGVVTLLDSSGISYGHSALHRQYAEGANGAIRASETKVVFSSIRSLSALGTIRLLSTHYSDIIDGPWTFDVSLP